MIVIQDFINCICYWLKGSKTEGKDWFAEVFKDALARGQIFFFLAGEPRDHRNFALSTLSQSNTNSVMIPNRTKIIKGAEK